VLLVRFFRTGGVKIIRMMNRPRATHHHHPEAA
jgi:hypothetical protein